METRDHPEFQTALHFARLWKVVAMQGGMDREKATIFAVQQAAALLTGTSRYSQVHDEGPELIRADLQGIEPKPHNPLHRAGFIDTRS